MALPLEANDRENRCENAEEKEPHFVAEARRRGANDNFFIRGNRELGSTAIVDAVVSP